MTLKKHWPSALLLIVVTLSLFFMVHNTQPITRKPDSHRVDVFMKNVSYQSFDTNGQIRQRVFAPHMKHFAHNNTAVFEAPMLTLYTKKRAVWTVNAQHGKSLHGTQTITLWGHVSIHQTAEGNRPETTITTSALTIYPNQSLAESDRAVTITRPGSTISGVGLRANIKTGKFILRSHSEGSYDPKKAKNASTHL